ncbi:MAG: TonB family protein [Terriglobales bacterium]
MAASQKIRTGLVELRTSTGSVYAKPSFWERVYLLWMFRNFHCLPKEVLGLHQRRLIDKLCRAAVRQRSIAHTDIIGIVENVQLMMLPKADVTTTTSNLLEMISSTVEVSRPRAVAAGGTSMRWEPPSDRGEGARLIVPGPAVEEISSLRPHLPLRDDGDPAPAVARRTGVPLRAVAWILAGAFATLGIGILLRFQADTRPEARAIVSQTPVEASSPPPFSIQTTAAPPEPAPLFVASAPKPTPAIPESKPSPSPISSPHPESKPSDRAVAHHQSAASVAANEGSASEPRLRVAQPPASGFRYPEAPSFGMTGKVSLRAVIGTDGSVKKVDVLSGNRTLAEAAVQAVRHWRYPAPEMNGHAAEAETDIAINFVGDDAVSVSFPAAH